MHETTVLFHDNTDARAILSTNFFFAPLQSARNVVSLISMCRAMNKACMFLKLPEGSESDFPSEQDRVMGGTVDLWWILQEVCAFALGACFWGVFWGILGRVFLLVWGR